MNDTAFVCRLFYGNAMLDRQAADRQIRKAWRREARINDFLEDVAVHYSPEAAHAAVYARYRCGQSSITRFNIAWGEYPEIGVTEILRSPAKVAVADGGEILALEDRPWGVDWSLFAGNAVYRGVCPGYLGPLSECVAETGGVFRLDLCYCGLRLEEAYGAAHVEVTGIRDNRALHPRKRPGKYHLPAALAEQDRRSLVAHLRALRRLSLDLLARRPCNRMANYLLDYANEGLLILQNLYPFRASGRDKAVCLPLLRRKLGRYAARHPGIEKTEIRPHLQQRVDAILAERADWLQRREYGRR